MGRPLNSANKNKAYLLKRLQDMYGADFNPVIKVAENAVALQLAADNEPDKTEVRVAAVNAWDKVAQYVEPKLKAIEVSGELSGKVIVKRINLSGNAVDNDATD